MRVHIDDLFSVECVSIAGYWNGWARPLFTRKQLDTVRDSLVASGALLYDIDGNELADSANADMTKLDYVTKHDDDLYEVCGWIWSVVVCPIHCDDSRMNDDGECDECLDDAHEAEIMAR